MPVDLRSAIGWWVRVPCHLTRFVIGHAAPPENRTLVEELTRSLSQTNERLELLINSQESTRSALASLTTFVCTLDLKPPAPSSPGYEVQLDELLALQQRTNDLLELVLASFVAPRPAD
jgi:hypothetical protein